MDLSIGNYRNNPHFTAIHLQKSKMNKTQKLMAETLSNVIHYSDSYQTLSKGKINTVIIPGEKPTSIKIKYVDPKSWTFIQDKKGECAIEREIDNKKYKELYDIADTIIEDLRNIISGIIPKPNVNTEKILLGNTDLATLDPNAYIHICKDIKELETYGLDRNSATDLVLDEFTRNYSYKDINI